MMYESQPQSRSRDPLPAISRRAFVATMAAAMTPALGQTALARQAALPLENLGLEHLDIVVPDTAESARFYRRIFDTALHEQPFQGSIRYFILLGDLPSDRQVGYIAIGAAGDRPAGIGHYCALAETYDREAVNSALEAAGYPTSSGGFGMIPDVDGIQLQLFTLPAGLVTAAVPSDLSVEPGGLVEPVGMDHVLMRVSDMDRSLAYYRLMYGEGLESRDTENAERVWFQLGAQTRLGLEPAPAGQAPRLERFGIKVRAFDSGRVSDGLEAAGAEVMFASAGAGRVRFRDNYGIVLEIAAV
jgi:catechol 2,3-dioxygenase-like lactoylglutathione lyase family enzyme